MKITQNAGLAVLTAVALILGAARDSQAASILSIDFNERATDDGTNTAAGFSPFQIGSVGTSALIQTAATVRVFGAYTVTLANSAPEGYDDRLRGGVLTNNMSFTDHLLFRDFVFSRPIDLTSTGGLDLSIAGLNPNETYNIRVWSWDMGSGGTRVSDWSINGTPFLDNYTFDGRVYPDDNSDYQFTVNAAADASGVLLLSGRRDPTSVDATPAASFGVFLNAVQVSTVPEPSTYALLGLGVLSFLGLRRIRRG